VSDRNAGPGAKLVYFFTRRRFVVRRGRVARIDVSAVTG
jgi:hypothetical protein